METKEIIERLERQNYVMEKRYEILKSMICDIYDEIIPHKKICPICKSEIRCYIPYGKPMRYHAQCPVCLGAERERLLARFLDMNWDNLTGSENKSAGKIRLLHFAPELGFHQRFSSMKDVEYYPVDFNPNYPFDIVNVVDITDIPYPDNYFDLIICFHVLQYVKDEGKALDEVKRVLAPEGNAIFCDNINQILETTLESDRYSTPALKEQYYGNAQYVRRYGRDYLERLSNVWERENISKYSVDELEEDEISKYFLLCGEEIYIYKKRK